jgi:hypothetical protein
VRTDPLVSAPSQRHTVQLIPTRGVVGRYLKASVARCYGVRESHSGLNRTQPGLPLSFGQPATRTPDDKAAWDDLIIRCLDVATGRGISRRKRRHRSAEFLQFLNAIETVVPG